MTDTAMMPGFPSFGATSSEAQPEEPFDELVLSKYRDAGAIANKVLYEAIKMCVADASIADICRKCDDQIRTMTGGVYTKGDLEKGIAFPTCVSINNCAGNYSPFADESIALSPGDTAKVKLGVHIDGYIASVSHTVLVGAPADEPVVGRVADVVCAGVMACDIASRIVKVGHKASDVAECVRRVGECYGCAPLEGSSVARLGRFMAEGDKIKFLRPEDDGGADDFEFTANNVYMLDIAYSTGRGAIKPEVIRNTVFRRNLNKEYQLKLKAGRQLFSLINQDQPALAFSLPSYALDESNADRKIGMKSAQLKLAVAEIARNDLVYEYPVLFDSPDTIIASQSVTILVPDGGQPLLLTGKMPLPYVSSEGQLTGDLERLLHTMQQPKAPKTGKQAQQDDQARLHL